MYLNIKILKSIIIFVILISPVFLFSSPSEATNNLDLFGIDSFIEIEIDTSFLDDHLSIDKTYIIPITIKYHTNIPLIYKNLPSIILFHSFSKPLQKIHLEINNPPIWADISINPPDILTHIPFDGEEAEISYSYILLKLKKEAPATAYRMNLIASCSKIGMLNGDLKTSQIIFTPEWIPGLEINNNSDSIEKLNFHKNISFPINITNNGNSISVISIDFISFITEINPFDISIEPKIVSTNIKETKQILISINTLYEDIYHYGYKPMILGFSLGFTPINSNTNEQGLTYLLNINIDFTNLLIEFN